MTMARRMKILTLTLPGVKAARLSPLMAGTLVLLALTAVVAGVFAAFAILGPRNQAAQSAVQEWKPPTLASVELPPPKSPSADVQTLSRPIFSKNRKPSVKAAAGPTAEPVPAATTAAPADLTLAAIVKHGGAASAFIISGSAPEGEWKKIGDLVDSWTVASISDSDLTLKNGDQAVKLRLFPDPPQ